MHGCTVESSAKNCLTMSVLLSRWRDVDNESDLPLFGKGASAVWMVSLLKLSSSMMARLETNLLYQTRFQAVCNII